MKKITVLTIAWFFSSIIIGQEQPVYHKNENFYMVQDIKHLIGKVSRPEVEAPPYDQWFLPNYEAYQPKNPGKSITRKLKNIDIKIVYGTWCGDSKREVPRFQKLIDEWGIKPDQVEYLALSNITPYYKRGLKGEEKGLDIHRVPTFIFYKNNQEIGRIVEYPVNDLQTDLVQILLGYPSQPQYKGVSLLMTYLKKTPLNSAEIDKERIQRSLRFLIRRSSELNSLGYVYLSQDKTVEAIYTFKINTELFPEDPNTFDSLGEAYFSINQLDKAKKAYDQVLRIDGNNQNARLMLDRINNMILSKLHK